MCYNCLTNNFHHEKIYSLERALFFEWPRSPRRHKSGIRSTRSTTKWSLQNQEAPLRFRLTNLRPNKTNILCSKPQRLTMSQAKVCASGCQMAKTSFTTKRPLKSRHSRPTVRTFAQKSSLLRNSNKNSMVRKLSNFRWAKSKPL